MIVKLWSFISSIACMRAACRPVSLGSAAGAFALVAGASSDARALETRTMVVGWFGQATVNTDKDCPGGLNPVIGDQYLKHLADLGYSGDEIEEMARKSAEGVQPDPVLEIVRMRGRVNGKPVNAYIYPETGIDPKLKPLQSQFAYGFDLDGKGESQPSAFTDPETLEKGVDHQMYRALGCMRSFHGSLTGRPTYWAWAWGQTRDSQPAWIITISGEDLSKDGDVTVTLNRAHEHLKSNPDGSPKADATYRPDNDPRSQNVFPAVLKNGVITTKQAQDVRILQNPLIAPELLLDRAKLRITLKEDGSATGMIGGYQPWKDIYWGMASGAPGIEICVTGDIVGMYYLLKHHADYAPDETGQNQKISATYYFEAVPAFAVTSTARTANR